MRFEGDAFISYAHIDNQPVIEGRDGWVSNFKRALEIRLEQRLGEDADIWWDPKLQGNDVFSDVLLERLRQVAALVTVVTPRYVRSEWGQKELEEFVRAAERHGGLDVQDRSRLFKVIKTPVPLDEHPASLQPLLGYEFYWTDPESGRVRELDESGIFGPEAKVRFWMRLDDVADDLCRLLEALEDLGEGRSAAAGEAGAIFLAETTGDLREAREAIKRDLQQHGYNVLPARPLPLSMPELEGALREDLERCRMSIHMIGRTYSFVPEGAVKSVQEIQHELASARAAAGSFTRLLWIPPGLATTDPRQAAFVETLRTDPRGQRGSSDLLETPLEGLKTQITDRLKRTEKAPAPAAATEMAGQIYLIYDQRDADRVFPWQEYFFTRGYEVLHPLFEGDEADVREYHEENLRICDCALVVHGAASESWLRRKLRELQKSAGLGRAKKKAVVAISLIEPRTVEKERFRTREAIVLEQWEGFSPQPLEAVLSRLTGPDP